MLTILEKFPSFQPSWDSFKAYWGEEDELGLCNSMGNFSDYIFDLLLKNQTEETAEAFAFIEYLLNVGDEEVQTCATTCFLENILNRTPEEISGLKYTHMLGEKSKEYCRDWDEFTGIKTEGLW